MKLLTLHKKGHLTLTSEKKRCKLGIQILRPSIINLIVSPVDRIYGNYKHFDTSKSLSAQPGFVYLRQLLRCRKYVLMLFLQS